MSAGFEFFGGDPGRPGQQQVGTQLNLINGTSLAQGEPAPDDARFSARPVAAAIDRETGRTATI